MCNLGKDITYDKIIIVLFLTYGIIQFIRPSAANTVCENFIMVFPRVLVDNTHEWMSVDTAFEI